MPIILGLMKNLKLIAIVGAGVWCIWFLNRYVALRTQETLTEIQTDMRAARESLEAAADEYEKTTKAIEALAEAANEADSARNHVELVDRIGGLKSFNSELKAGPATKKAITDIIHMGGK